MRCVSLRIHLCHSHALKRTLLSGTHASALVRLDRKERMLYIESGGQHAIELLAILIDSVDALATQWLGFARSQCDFCVFHDRFDIFMLFNYRFNMFKTLFRLIECNIN